MSVIVDKPLYCIRVLVAFYPLKKMKLSTIVSRLNILAWIKRYLKHLCNKYLLFGCLDHLPHANATAVKDVKYFKNSYCTVASNKFWSSMSFQNLVRLSQI
jgi:hypothetical protein